jgi:aldehyde dehydrogenase (NAD+)
MKYEYNNEPLRRVATALGLPDVVTAHVDGQFLPSAGRAVFEVEDPATTQVIATVAESSDDVVDRAASSAKSACWTWGRLDGVERGRILLRLAEVIRRHAGDLAVLETLDTGKPLRQARGDVETSARYFEYFGGVADKILGQTLPPLDGYWSYTLREPYGVVAHVTPWNSPLSQMCRGIAPCLAAGNTVVVKPSELAPLSTVAAAALFVEAGLPAGVCNVTPGGPAAGVALVSHPDVGFISFTGSVPTGKKVMRMAAERVAGVNLELGGKSPTIVLPDADMAAAVAAGAAAVVRNAGQSCYATTRLLVHRSILDRYTAEVVDAVSRLRVGPGLDDPDLGPVISADQLNGVEAKLEAAREEGATLAVGGRRPQDLKGHFLTPAVLTGVRNDMRVAREEVFGPVQAIIAYDEEDEAVAMANDSPYGLAAGVFTRDLKAAHRLARHLQVGQVLINRYPMGGVDTPFGGYRQSGIGRERGLAAMIGYTQLKTVVVDV